MVITVSCFSNVIITIFGLYREVMGNSANLGVLVQVRVVWIVHHVAYIIVIIMATNSTMREVVSKYTPTLKPDFH